MGGAVKIIHLQNERKWGNKRFTTKASSQTRKKETWEKRMTL